MDGGAGNILGSRLVSRTYYCTCLRLCEGGKNVSKNTYDRHEAARIEDALADIDAPDHSFSTTNGDTLQLVNAYPEVRFNEERQPEPFDSLPHEMTEIPPANVYGERAVQNLSTGLSKHTPINRTGVPFEFDIPALLLPTISAVPHHDPPVECLQTVSDSLINDRNVPDPGSVEAVELENLNREPTYRPLPETEHLEFDPEAHSGTVKLESLRDSLAFLQAIKTASLDDHYSQRTPSLVETIRNPAQSLHEFSDPDEHLAIDIYLSLQNASEGMYEMIRLAYTHRHPDSKLLSLHEVKQKISSITGIVLITYDMCVNSCTGFVGPYYEQEVCPYCFEPRYHPIPGAKRVPRQQFNTFPVGPQLQALWQNPDSAAQMRYRIRFTHSILEKMKMGCPPEVFSDVLMSSEIINAIRDGRIKNGDVILMLSLNGAQLYCNKESDCWIYIWIILDHSPNVRYKKDKVLVGAVIPGPNKPKNLDSFLFPGIHHLSALQRDRLPIWDAKNPRREPFLSHPFFAIGATDGPGMVYLNGLVGHVGRMGCRLYCGQPGRRKPRRRTYYPAKLKLSGEYNVPGCDQPDHGREPSSTKTEDYLSQLVYVLQSPNNAEYERRRLETGISRSCLFLGLPALHTLQVPTNFVGDVMHLGTLNITDLLINLWRGKLKCESTDSVNSWEWATLRDTGRWNAHGKQVADATPYLPGSFGRPPRNPAEKINSGYKAWEFVLYFYELGPAVFLEVLPFAYWRHFCQLVFAMRILNQHNIHQDDLSKAHEKLLDFTMEFETLYYQWRSDRLHFVRPSIHTLSHLAQEVPHVGPPICTSQWTMERAIGYLTSQIRQSSTTYANLSAICLRQCQINALVAIHPELSHHKKMQPAGSVDLGDGYILLNPKDRNRSLIAPVELLALLQYITSIGHSKAAETIRKNPQLTQWARLQLPNDQIARCAWKESSKPFNKVRMARNVKIISNGELRFAEVQYYLRLRLERDQRDPSAEHEIVDVTLAVVRLYSAPDHSLLTASWNTLWSTRFLGEEGTEVIDYKSIIGMVGMVPHNPYRKGVTRWFVVQKPGLDAARMGGMSDEETG